LLLVPYKIAPRNASISETESGANGLISGDEAEPFGMAGNEGIIKRNEQRFVETDKNKSDRSNILGWRQA
jgi:hypothetical protein